jgi:hypothetical protein
VNVRVELVCTGADGTEQRRDVIEIERAALAMETLGMNLNEGKAVLEGLQKLVVSQQVRP